MFYSVGEMLRCFAFSRLRVTGFGLALLLVLGATTGAGAQEMPGPENDQWPGLPEVVEQELPPPTPEVKEPEQQGVDESSFEPRYLIERIEIIGNARTRASVIRDELRLARGDVVDAADRRVRLARARLLSLGHFLDVRLSLSKGKTRGSAVLRVQVQERGTLVLKALHLGASRATPLWAGAEVEESNLGGRGYRLWAGGMGAVRGDVNGAQGAHAAHLGMASPLRPHGFALIFDGLYNQGNEFHRLQGGLSDPDPVNFVAVRARRWQGRLALAKSLTPTIHFEFFSRVGIVEAMVPSGVPRPGPALDYDVLSGRSWVNTVGGQFEADERNSIRFPRRGRFWRLNFQIASRLLGADYAYSRFTLGVSQYVSVAGTHALSFHLFAGAIFGDAPYFERFFVGDLNPLMAGRVMGLNMTTASSWNLLGAGMAGHRYDDYAGRIVTRYAVPLWRRQSGLIYGGDAFVSAGFIAMVSERQLRDGLGGYDNVPVDAVFDLGLRLDTRFGIVNLTLGNALGRMPIP